MHRKVKIFIWLCILSSSRVLIHMYSLPLIHKQTLLYVIAMKCILCKLLSLLSHSVPQHYVTHHVHRCPLLLQTLHHPVTRALKCLNPSFLKPPFLFPLLSLFVEDAVHWSM